MLEPLNPAAPVTMVFILFSLQGARDFVRVTTAVPSLPTTMPAAMLAMRMASGPVGTGSNHAASVAMTVSPAPGKVEHFPRLRRLVKVWPSAKSVMPSSLRVTSKASRPSSPAQLLGLVEEHVLRRPGGRRHRAIRSGSG
jgi:hypothetical protein